jgi:hypothetical protein
MLLEHPARLAEPAISSAVNLGRLVSGNGMEADQPILLERLSFIGFPPIRSSPTV